MSFYYSKLGTHFEAVFLQLWFENAHLFPESVKMKSFPSTPGRPPLLCHRAPPTTSTRDAPVDDFLQPDDDAGQPEGGDLDQ